MKRTLKSSLTACVLILIMVCLGTVIGGDVIVKEGDVTAETGRFEYMGVGIDPNPNRAIIAQRTYTTPGYKFAMHFQPIVNLTETDYSTTYGVAVYPTLRSNYPYYGGLVGIFAQPCVEHTSSYMNFAIGIQTMPTLTGSGTTNKVRGIYISNPYTSGSETINHCYGIEIEQQTKGQGQNNWQIYSRGGKSYFAGEISVDKLEVRDADPRTVEFELEERDNVIERYEKYVTPDKRSGVAYINSKTKQIELYYPYEGVIRNILGATIHTLPSIRINNNYETYYEFDRLTGQVVEKQRAIYDKYRIKDGIEFDHATGQFIDGTSKETIPKEEAIELYK